MRTAVPMPARRCLLLAGGLLAGGGGSSALEPLPAERGDARRRELGAWLRVRVYRGAFAIWHMRASGTGTSRQDDLSLRMRRPQRHVSAAGREGLLLCCEKSASLRTS